MAMSLQQTIRRRVIWTALRWGGQDYLFWQQLTLRKAKAYHKNRGKSGISQKNNIYDFITPSMSVTMLFYPPFTPTYVLLPLPLI